MAPTSRPAVYLSRNPRCPADIRDGPDGMLRAWDPARQAGMEGQEPPLAPPDLGEVGGAGEGVSRNPIKGGIRDVAGRSTDGGGAAGEDRRASAARPRTARRFPPCRRRAGGASTRRPNQRPGKSARAGSAADPPPREWRAGQVAQPWTGGASLVQHRFGAVHVVSPYPKSGPAQNRSDASAAPLGLALGRALPECLRNGSRSSLGAQRTYARRHRIGGFAPISAIPMPKAGARKLLIDRRPNVQ